MRSFATAALYLAVIHTSDARVPHSFRDLIHRDASPESQPQEGLFGWMRSLFRRDVQRRQDATCYEDDYYTFVGSPSLGEGFCQDYMDYPNRTVPVEATATSTFTTTYTTDVDTITEYTHVTPAATLTETVTANGGAKVKRDAAAQITPRAILNRMEAFQLYRRQTNNTSVDDSAMAEAFSSACNCHDYEGPVVSETHTGQTTVRTLRAFGNVDTTVTQTQTAAPSVATTTTTTVTASLAATSAEGSPSEGSTPIEGSEPEDASPTSDDNPANPTPTAPPFTCPDDNSTVVSQMVGSERFDYLVLCDTLLMDAGIYNGVLSYGSFAECVGACSVADQQFDNPVCQGVSFYATDDSGAGNCFLKGAANNSIRADGVNSALLQSIELGVTNDTVQGTATEMLPFAGVQATSNPAQFNSMMASMLANSTDAMPMVTPINQPAMSGRQMAAITAYSTYISDGSTFSTGTGYTYSTSFANGSWYYAYYTSYTKTWASATTVYGASETGTVVENSTQVDSYQTNGENGQYGTVTTLTTQYPNNGTTKTEVQTVSYEANGTPFFSTTTTYWSYATGVAGGGAGGSGSGSPAFAPAGPLITPTGISNNGSSSGGEEGGAAGGPGSGGLASTMTSTTTFVTQTVISTGGATGGASSGFGSGGLPVTYTGISTIITNGSTAYETYYIISGGPQGTGSVDSGQESGAAGTGSLTPITVISTAGSTGYQSGVAASGGPGNTGGASSLVLSGGPLPSSSPSVQASLSIVTVISNSGAANGASSGFGAGGPGATGGASSLILSSGPSSPLTASFPSAPRSGDYSTSITSNVTAPSGTATTASFPSAPRVGDYSESSSATAPGTAPTTNATAPPGTSPLTASFSDVPRAGDYSSSSSSPPIFTPPTGGVYSATGTAPSGSLPGTAPSGTAPSRTAPSGTVPLGTAPPGTSPAGTAPPGTSPGTYTAPQGNRSGDYSSSAPSGTAPTAPTGYLPYVTGPLPSGPTPYPAPSGSAPSGSTPSSGAPSSSAPNGTAPGTGPTPSGTAITTGTGGASSLILTGYYPGPSGAPPGTSPIPTGTSPLTFSLTDRPRVPGSESSMSGTMPMSTAIAFPTVQTSCANMTMGTTTLFSTTTVYGCYSTCLPSWGGWGGYGGPHPFGPPATDMPETEETVRV